MSQQKVVRHVLVVGLIAWLASGAAAFAADQAESTADKSSESAFTPAELRQIEQLEAQSKVFRRVARMVGPAVVFIKATTVEDLTESPSLKELPEPWRKFLENDPRFRERRRSGTASGVIIDAAEGLILTNNHVVEGAKRLDVTLADKRSFQAEVVSTDPPTELAVIRIPPENLQAIQIGDGDKIEVGDWVIAVGNPFGLSQTFTRGMVSALGRSNLAIAEYEDFIQTDAAINPGNSGGPLVNLRGQMIGLNSAIATSARRPGNVGIGFAIPARIIQDILPILRSGKKVVRGYLGVEIQDLADKPGLAATFGLTGDRGALVVSVMNEGPADKAGLKQDDIILEIEGQPIRDAKELRDHIARVTPDTTVSLKIWREEAEKTVKVTVGQRPEGLASRGEPADRQKEDHFAKSDDLGLSVRTLTPELAETFKWDEQPKGVVIVEIDPLGEAASMGLKVGYLILKVQNERVTTARDFRQALKKHPLSRGVRLLIRTPSGSVNTYVQTH